jgi:dolichol-phosphate mannosyltransferase
MCGCRVEKMARKVQLMTCPADKFALVVPTLNEAGNIGIVLDRAVSAMSQFRMPWEILVVDDDSTDGTGEIVRRYSEAESRVRLLVRRRQRGLAGAICYGWAHSNADLLGVMDADLQHPPDLLPLMISESYNGFDVVIASRYIKPHSMDEWNPARRALSRLSVLASTLVQKPALRVKDPMSGFFVLRRECITGLDFQSAGFKLLLEILTRGHVTSATEVPFKFGPRHLGTSKAGAMTAVHYLSLLYKLSRELVFGERNAL